VRASDIVWKEGEAPSASTVSRHPWWYDKVKKDELSGGDFISHWGDKPGEVSYEFQAPADQEYAFWVRANPVATKLSYALDKGEWLLIDMKAPEDQKNIAEDDKPDLRFIAWIKAGSLKLTKGAHTLKFKMHSDNHNHGMLDCFVLAAGAFAPNGKLKPGEKAAAVVAVSTEGRWAFQPAKDEFSPDALLDLRALNEKVAGESGFVTRSKDGSGFVLGDGKPVRFWAVNGGVSQHPLHPGADPARNARFLAKRGINLSRCFIDVPSGKSLNEINVGDRERLWSHVAAMKKEGIYTLLTPIWIGQSKINPKLGYLDDGGNHNWGLLFFDPKLQAAYRSWMKLLLTEKNPHTGIPLAQDPALAILEIQNEDSLLFYTAQGIKGAARKELRRQFGDFLKKKYGTLEKTMEAWGNAKVGRDSDAPDDLASGEIGLAMTWELTQHRFGEAFQKRVNDQMEFLCRTMHAFNKMVGDYLKNELGCKQLVNAGNWRTADNVILLDGERWSYSANDVMAVNRYYTGIHEGKNAGWAICNGDKLTDDSALLRPRAIPVNLKQVEGYPILVTESSWVPPLSYQSEGPFLVAAYQSLSGVAGYFWFAMGEEAWADWTINSANGYMPSQGKWLCNTPMLMGQWPAAALLYRMGYLKKGDPAVHEQRALADVFSRAMPIIAEDEGYDPNRDKGLIPRESNIKDGVDPLAYLVGPVVVTYGGDPAKSKVADLSKYIDSAKKTVKSSTGELELNHGVGLCKMDSPKAQGATGFLKAAGKIALSDIEIASGNDYATVMVVSMDDAPLAASGKVLVQVGTTERSTGWATKPAQTGGRKGEEIVNFGKAPWQIVNADITVTIRNAKVTKARVLDANGMPVQDAELQATGAGKTLKFPPNALYVILQ
jgi:hypothetical protein